MQYKVTVLKDYYVGGQTVSLNNGEWENDSDLSHTETVTKKRFKRLNDAVAWEEKMRKNGFRCYTTQKQHLDINPNWENEMW